MGERKGTNKYYPPDFDPAKHFSLAGYHKQHPLRERARKLKSHGILVIRFEMPYNIWCDGCNNHVGMGVRYNAEKSKIGMYYSTPIWKFRMKCALCDNHYEIKTDPANQDYVIISGARRKEQRWDPVANEQVVPEDRETHKKLETDPMYKLEHGLDDRAKVTAAVPTLERIEQIQSQWKDDFRINQLARQRFRAEKKSIAASKEADRKLLEKASLGGGGGSSPAALTLLPEDERDVRLAGLLRYGSVVRRDEAPRSAAAASTSAASSAGALLDTVGWFDAASPAATGSAAAGGGKLAKLAELRSKAKAARHESSSSSLFGKDGSGGLACPSARVRSRSAGDAVRLPPPPPRAASAESAGDRDESHDDRRRSAPTIADGCAVDAVKSASVGHSTSDARDPTSARARDQTNTSLCDYSDSDSGGSSSSS